MAAFGIVGDKAERPDVGREAAFRHQYLLLTYSDVRKNFSMVAI